MKSFLNLRQQLSSAVSAEYRRIWRGFKFPTTNKKPRRFFNRAVIGRRFTHLREYSCRLIGSALGLYRHMDHGHSLGYASVTHRNMMEHCTRIRRDQVAVLGSLLHIVHIGAATVPVCKLYVWRRKKSHTMANFHFWKHKGPFGFKNVIFKSPQIIFLSNPSYEIWSQDSKMV